MHSIIRRFGFGYGQVSALTVDKHKKSHKKAARFLSTPDRSQIENTSQCEDFPQNNRGKECKNYTPYFSAQGWKSVLLKNKSGRV